LVQVGVRAGRETLPVIALVNLRIRIVAAVGLCLRTFEGDAPRGFGGHTGLCRSSICNMKSVCRTEAEGQ